MQDTEEMGHAKYSINASRALDAEDAKGAETCRKEMICASEGQGRPPEDILLRHAGQPGK